MPTSCSSVAGPLEVVRDSNGKYCPKAFISGYTPYRRTWEAVFEVPLIPRKGSDGGPEQMTMVMKKLGGTLFAKNST